MEVRTMPSGSQEEHLRLLCSPSVVAALLAAAQLQVRCHGGCAGGGTSDAPGAQEQLPADVRAEAARCAACDDVPWRLLRRVCRALREAQHAGDETAKPGGLAWRCTRVLTACRHLTCLARRALAARVGAQRRLAPAATQLVRPGSGCPVRPTSSARPESAWPARFDATAGNAATSLSNGWRSSAYRHGRCGGVPPGNGLTPLAAAACLLGNNGALGCSLCDSRRRKSATTSLLCAT